MNPQKNQPLTNLGQLLDRFEQTASEKEEISIGALVQAVGNRSFGPLLLIAGLITMAPVIGDIPGVPTVMGIIVFLLAIQLVLHRRHFWLPKWVLHRSMASDKLDKGLKWSRKPARFIDRWLKPRWALFVQGPAEYVIALSCLLIALTMPSMELIPFSANLAGAALTAFGLALIAHDGILAFGAFLVTALIAGLIAYNFL